MSARHGGLLEVTVYTVRSRALRRSWSRADRGGSGYKWYAPGVGLVQDDEFVLVQVEKSTAQPKGDVKQAADQDEGDDDDD